MVKYVYLLTLYLPYLWHPTGAEIICLHFKTRVKYHLPEFLEFSQKFNPPCSRILMPFCPVLGPGFHVLLYRYTLVFVLFLYISSAISYPISHRDLPGLYIFLISTLPDLYSFLPAPRDLSWLTYYVHDFLWLDLACPLIFLALLYHFTLNFPSPYLDIELALPDIDL